MAEAVWFIGYQVQKVACPGCGGGPAYVVAATVDPTDKTLEGDPVYDVTQRCDSCGHTWESLVCFEHKEH
jgi:hypothetical protein